MKHPLHVKAPNIGNYVADSCQIQVNGEGQKRYVESFATPWTDAAEFDAMWLAFETKRKQSLETANPTVAIQAAITVSEEEIAKIQNS